jgi:hypothetical protein
VLEDDPARYGGEPRRQIAGRTTQRAEAGGLARYLGGVRGAGPAFGEPRRDGARMAAIRRAAHVPLAALVPDPRTFARGLAPRGEAVVDAVGGAAALKLAYGLAVHLPLTTAVTFPKAEGSAKLHDHAIPADTPVTVRVTHLFHCAVPVAAALICRKLERPRSRWLDWLPWGRKKNPALDELRQAPLAKAHGLLALSSARFATLRAEATLPAQGAAYRYASEEGGAR